MKKQRQHIDVEEQTLNTWVLTFFGKLLCRCFAEIEDTEAQYTSRAVI